MKKRRRLRRKIKIRQGSILMCTILILSFILMYSKAYQLKITSELKIKKTNIEAQIDRISADIAMLNKDIERSKTLEFIEKTAREDYRMVKPREVIYIFNDRAND